MKLLVVGDSHSLFWRGHSTVIDAPLDVPGLDILHFSAATAYGLGRPNSKYRWLLSKFLAKRKHSAFVLSFGEIDCRAHIVKYARANGVSVETEARRVAHRYLDTIRELQGPKPPPIILLAPPASTPSFSWSAMPTVGDETERNRATLAFTEVLEDAADENMRVVSILDEMIDATGRTAPGFLFDGVHVSQEAMPLMMHRLDAALASLGVARGTDPGSYNLACQPLAGPADDHAADRIGQGLVAA